MKHSFSPDADGLGALLLRLYAAAASGDVPAFQGQALDLVEGLLPFDGGWWGRSMLADGLHRVHCSHLHRLPPDTADRLNLTDPHNLVARRTRARPGVAHWFGPQDWAAQTSTAALAQHMGIAQALCITQVDPTTGLASFVSLARRTRVPRFSADEARWLERLAPHLAGGLDLCLLRQLSTLQGAGRQAVVATDAEGWLHVAEAAAVVQLQREWPGWTGPRLPQALRERIAARRQSFLGRHLHAGIEWRADHVFMTLRARDARDLLTRREQSVALAFATGRSYREVAQLLDVAPATVRHHLRAAYLKLGVTDKAALATTLAGTLAPPGSAARTQML